MAAAMLLNALRDEANMFTRFQQLQLLQDGSTPDFIVEVITLFCKDGERFIGELAKLLDKSCVDFDKVDAFVHQLKGSSARVYLVAYGLLDDQFQQLQLLQDGSTPDFIVEVITLFCKDGERFIGELAKLLDKSCVDFDKVDAFVHQLKGSSASVGARRVKNTCIQFHVSCQEKSRDGCLKILDAVRNDFYDLCSKFQTMLQLEQRVHAFNPKQ